MIAKSITRFLIGILFCTGMQSLFAQDKSESYRIETIPMPDGLTSETGAVEFFLMAVLWHVLPEER